MDEVLQSGFGSLLVPAHIGQGTTVPLVPWMVAAALVGFGTAVSMLLLRFSAASTPARVVAATLWRTTPDDAPDISVVVVHCGSGVLAGIVYVLTAADVAYLLPEFPKVNDISVFPHLLAIGLTAIGLAFVFDTAFLFQVSTGERLRTLRRRWLLTLATYSVALSVCVPVFVRVYMLTSS